MVAAPSEVYSSMGLLASEYKLILQLLGREPSYTELGMFAVMWSEHCGYKYSRPVLAAFKKYKEAMEGAGLENAGVVDIGDGLGVTMKVESHNHPSAVEPYQGAATGVGGIIRDILTMGARPIASLNSLRFGPIRNSGKDIPVRVSLAPQEASNDQTGTRTGMSVPLGDATIDRNRYLFEHVVAGIAGYGNCVGVPTVWGEVGFHPRYSGNPLVNAMCVGILKLDEITTAAASGVGNPVLYLGSATGRDGIHGATFASEALDDESDAKRPNVQIGDPFAEKLLIEATLEALQTGAIVAIQDMGAAGLTCSTIEMASQGSVGMTVDLDLVPMRESDMSGYELMLSESQERMLAVTSLGREDEVLRVFHKWGLKAVVIGHVTDDGVVNVTRHGETIASVDPKLLTDHCPTYQMAATEPDYFGEAGRFDPSTLPEVDINEALLTLLGEPEIASKRWVYEQYDQQVQTQSSLLPGASDAAVLAPRGTNKGLAVKIDGNSRYTYLHPYIGGQLAVAEAARNVACTGAKPVAVTDGLNFGNPEQPHVYWQFREAVQGIADAAEDLATPVISGNVSFYNQSELGEVPPTPLIGMLGVLEDASHALPSAPTGSGALGLVEVPIAKPMHEGIGASSYLAYVHSREDGYPVAPDLAGEKRLHEFLALVASTQSVVSAHDLSDGGLAVAVAEIAMKNLSVEVDLFPEPPTPSPSSAQTIAARGGRTRPDFTLFAEIPGRVLVGIPDNLENSLKGLDIAAEAKRLGLDFRLIGSYAPGGGLCIRIRDKDMYWKIDAMQQVYDCSIENVLNH